MTRAGAAALVIVGLLALATARAASATPGGELISFGAVTCAPKWQAPNPGRARFRIANRSARSATVYLFEADSGAIAATVSDLRPGATRAITVTLAAGTLYAWSCDLHGYPVHVSDTQQVPLTSQPGGPGRHDIPIQAGQLVAPLEAYRRYARARLATVGTQLANLSADVAAGNLAQARLDWLSAHLSWLQLGQDDGAYGAFGSLGASIDGTAAGVVGGTAGAGFTGFHRVEFDLWTQLSLPAAGRDITQLAALVSQITPTVLAADTPTSLAGLTTFTTRVHEVLEDALRDTLTGNDDYGSGTGVASLTADVAATREFLTLLAPLLAPRSPLLVSRARRQLSALLAAADAARVNGQWIGVGGLSERQRELIDADTGAVLETLAPIPDLLALGNT